MEHSDFPEQVPFPTALDEYQQSVAADEGPGSASVAPQSHVPAVFVFNPFAEGYIAHGKAFNPLKHQARLAEDLANLPQFLCEAHDIVLLPKRPATAFLDLLNKTGFQLPEFVQLTEGHLDPGDGLVQRKLGTLRPWAWGPDSVRLLEPLFARLVGEPRVAKHYFNDGIARLYSKAWSAEFLRRVLARYRGAHESAYSGAEGRSAAAEREAWLCSEQEAGMTVDTIEDAVQAITAIRCRGHHRVVVKQAHGLAGRNAIRLWEPEILPTQRQWLVRSLEDCRQLVVEPWLERELDFSVQLEMGPGGLKLCGYTGLINDRKGQFLANWVETDYRRCLSDTLPALFPAQPDISERIQCLYGEIASLLESELQSAGFAGPVSIDALVYRAPKDEHRLKPVVEINPRYTMGRLTLELMKHAYPGSYGLFRLVTRAQARAEGFAELSAYARSMAERKRLALQGEPPKIRQGALCLNDPGQARVCLATFEVSPTPTIAGALGGNKRQRAH